MNNCPTCERPYRSPEEAAACPCNKPSRMSHPTHSVRVGAIFERLVGQHFAKTSGSCNCKEVRDKMNRLGPDGCEESFEELIAEVMESAKMHSLWGRLAASLPLAETKVRQWLQQAINEARGQ